MDAAPDKAAAFLAAVAEVHRTAKALGGSVGAINLHTPNVPPELVPHLIPAHQYIVCHNTKHVHSGHGACVSYDVADDEHGTGCHLLANRDRRGDRCRARPQSALRSLRRAGEEGGVMAWPPRNSRVDLPGGPFCDKAWHAPSTARAAVVLRCASCGVVYARCDQCEGYKPGNTAASMRAHVRTAHQTNRDLRARVLPNEDDDT